jgi:2-isopropylmalate synthase
MNRVEIYDTTLRDGTQREGISLSCNDKLRIAQRLADLGVAYIEGGWPGSNPKDAEFFERVGELHLAHTQIAAFGSTRRRGVTAAADANLQALLAAGTPVCTVVGKTWGLHVTDVLQTTLADNLAMISESLAFLKSHGRSVLYDAEHFFDGYKADPAYALETLKAAIQGGAETLVLCDTNGGCLPWEVSEIVTAVHQALPAVKLGIHTHNDGECAVANSLVAIRAGAVHVQGTINGYGERCGNANLCSIIPDLELKMGYQTLPAGGLAKLTDLAHFVAEVANLAPDEHLAYVGKSAFAHKGGIHVAAMRRNPLSYQHIEPNLVGNTVRTVVSELSGRGNLLSKAEEVGLQLTDQQALGDALNEIKLLEAQGFSFEVAEASVTLLIQRKQPSYLAPFVLQEFFTIVEKRLGGRGTLAKAAVKMQVVSGNGESQEVFTITDSRNGPVNALDAALRKALAPFYPITEVALRDFKVRILDSAQGTAATTRVLIDWGDGSRYWTTIGAGANIIEASCQALVDSYEYYLLGPLND